MHIPFDRIGDNFKKARDVMSVDYIFVKDNDKKKYDELSYIENKKTLDDLPSEIREKLSNRLLTQ